jgi:hypothetical protein
MKIYGKFCGATIYVNQNPIKMDFIVADLDIGCDLLVGQPFLQHYKAHTDHQQGTCLLEVNGEPITIGLSPDHRARDATSTLAGAITFCKNNATNSQPVSIPNFSELLRQAKPPTMLEVRKQEAINSYIQLAAARVYAPATSCTPADWQRTSARALAAICHCHTYADIASDNAPQSHVHTNSTTIAAPTPRTEELKCTNPGILRTVSTCAATVTNDLGPQVPGPEIHPRPKRPYVPGTPQGSNIIISSTLGLSLSTVVGPTPADT